MEKREYLLEKGSERRYVSDLGSREQMLKDGWVQIGVRIDPDEPVRKGRQPQAKPEGKPEGKGKGKGKDEPAADAGDADGAAG